MNAHLAFDLSRKALRHSFAITKEGQRKASLSLGDGVIQIPGASVIVQVLGILFGQEFSTGLKRS